MSEAALREGWNPDYMTPIASVRLPVFDDYQTDFEKAVSFFLEKFADHKETNDG